MKIYVDEMPKSCADCPCMTNDTEYGCYCNLKDLDIQTDYNVNDCTYKYHRERHEDCPLKTIQSQLAEKEKEIKYYESEWKSCQIDLDHYKGECLNLQDEQNQKAIKQLEKVKSFLTKRKDDYLYLKDEIKAISYNQYVDFMNEVEIFELKIDQQINELKGEK